MVITDSQVHIWGANTADRPWPKGGEARAQRPVPLEMSELLAEMDAAGVDRAVIVPPSWEGDRNDIALEATRRYPDRLAVMGRVDLSQPDFYDIGRWRDQVGMLGVRLTFHTGALLRDAEWLFRAASAESVPVMIFGPGLTSAFGDVARRFPELRLIIDHLNFATTESLPALGHVIEPLLALAELENVAVKLSALPCLLRPEDRLVDLAPSVRAVVDAFGAERSMWGSDLSRLPIDYAEWVQAGLAGFGCLSEEETRLVMGETLAYWLNWPAAPTSS
jgi:predicted TIM-barrel fold metal-dependent hydrolase